MKARIYLLATLVAGCAANGEIKNSEEVANVYVSAYPAVPWTDIRDKLVPHNNLTIESARTMATSVTQIQVEQALSILGAGLAIGLPGRTDTRTQNTDATGATATTRSASQFIGSVPSTLSVPSAAIASGDLAPDFSKTPASTSADGLTTLMGGTALYQQAQILDNQITSGIEPQGYQAHMVTFQVNLQPNSRSQPYDAYVNITLMPADWQQALALSEPLKDHADALPPVIVYPLIVSDAFEFTNASRSVEAIRQLSLQLAGTISQIGASAGINSSKNDLRSVVGLDENSLVTLGRVNENTLRIRLGATSATKGEWAMVPRTYNISTVVFTRFTPGNKALSISSLSAVTETQFVSAIDGTVLKSSRLKDRSTVTNPTKDLFEDVFTEYTVDNLPSGKCTVMKIPEGHLDTPAQKLKVALANPEIKLNKTPTLGDPVKHRPTQEDLNYLNLLRALDRGDYNFVDECLGLKKDLGDSATPAKEYNARKQAGLRRLLAELMTMQTSSRYSKFLVPLRVPPDVKAPPLDQYVTMKDDGKTSTAITLHGGAGLSYSESAAMLELGKDQCPAPTKATPPPVPPLPSSLKDLGIDPALPARNKVYPSQINVANNGQDVQFTFPSIAAIKAPATPVRLLYRFTVPGYAYPDPTQPAASADSWYCYVLNSPPAPAKAEEPKVPDNPVTASQTLLVPDKDNKAQISLQVGEVDADFYDAAKTKAPYKKPLKLVVTGGNVRSDGGAGVSALSSKGVALTDNSVATLLLSNLTPETPVVIKTVDSSKSPKTVGTPITLTVDWRHRK